MNALTILNKTIHFVTFKMHKTRRIALLDCVKSLLAGNAAAVTSMGRGIASKAFEKHRIKRADRLLSNHHLQQETPAIYAVICKLFCVAKHPVIAVDWADLDDHKGHFLLRASMVLKGRPITLYQEIHSNATKEKAKTHRRFLAVLHAMLGKDCQPVVVTDAGFKSPWFRPVRDLGWHIVGRVRKPHFYSLDNGGHWQCISQLYKQARHRPKLIGTALIAKRQPFACSLVLFKHKNKGRHATNPDGSRKQSLMSLKHAKGASDPWLLATSLPATTNLAKRVVSIYQQRMQIEEGFRDMKSNRFGLGFEYNNTIKPTRLSVLVLLTTLASLVAILIGLATVVAGWQKRFQANTCDRPVLSLHSLGIRALCQRLKFTNLQWKQALTSLRDLAIGASYSAI